MSQRWLERTDLRNRFGLVAAWGVVIVVFGAASPDVFLTHRNFASIFGSQVVLLVLSLGLLITLTTGDFDVSVAFTCGLSAMIIAVLNTQHGWPIGGAVVVALAAGLAVGVMNGLIVVFFSVDSLIATLGTGTFIAGIVFWISGSNTFGGVSQTLVDWVIVKRILEIPVAFYYGLLLCIVLWLIFDFTRVGRHMLVVGRTPEVARLSGLHVSRLRWTAYVWSGLVAALAGVVFVGTSGAADPESFHQFLFPSFAAVFLGATAISPGRFNPWGTLIAVYFLTTGITGLQILGIGAFIQDIFYGSALVLAVILSQRAGSSVSGSPRQHLPPGADE